MFHCLKLFRHWRSLSITGPERVPKVHTHFFSGEDIDNVFLNLPGLLRAAPSSRKFPVKNCLNTIAFCYQVIWREITMKEYWPVLRFDVGYS